MPRDSAADTIRILVATDNHVGYNERDPVRGQDSWKTFHEIMTLAKDRDVDMILLAGDLFHENNPSRQCMFQVMQSIRMNCFGDKPCELQLLSDFSEVQKGVFGHANYQDEDLNVAIPLFSIHGNHDDPSGAGAYAALDLLSISGLVNYYGRVDENDKINIMPVLLQKGRTKLALYGLSNVRDERLYYMLKEQSVKWRRPAQDTKDWFNVLSVHQNRHKYSEGGYVPEYFLPDWMDLVVWGHEHECLIDPSYDPVAGFHVMQPGSSVATSLVKGEAVAKHVAIVSVTGKEFQSESIPLKSVRPLLVKDIILRDEPGMDKIAKKNENRPEITKYLEGLVNSMIQEANAEWRESHAGALNEPESDTEGTPLPIIRLRVECTPPDGGKFDVENPQRFSNRFQDRVANAQDVVHYHKKKTGVLKKVKDVAGLSDTTTQTATIDSVKVEKLVREFLSAQSLTILPQNQFGDAVGDFVDKDDRNAMQDFLDGALKDQVGYLLGIEDTHSDDEMLDSIEARRVEQETRFAAGKSRKNGAKLHRKPANWDSDEDGHWVDNPAAIIRDSSNRQQEENDGVEDEWGELPGLSHIATLDRVRGASKGATRGRGATASRANGAASRTTSTSRGRATKSTTRRRDSEDSDVQMVYDEVVVPPPARGSTKSTRARGSAKTAPPQRSSRQTQLSFSQTATQVSKTKTQAQNPHEISDDEISDDDDAFEPAPPKSRTRR